MKNWVLAARPKTLPAALVPVWVGTAPVLLGGWGDFSTMILVSTILGCLSIQIATNFFNDAIDSRKGADTEHRLGPRRVTAGGLFSARDVMIAGVLVCAAGAVAAIPLILRHGWIPIAIGSVSFLLAYGYTGGPFPLAYRGMGELFVILFFGFVAVMGSYYMQTGQWFPRPGLIAALQTGFYSTVLIAINNLRDIGEDRRSGKRTLAVRFGKTFARWEIGFFCFAPLLLWFGYPAIGGWSWAGLAISTLIASLITWQVFTREPGRGHNRLLGIAALQLIHFGIWFSIWMANEGKEGLDLGV